MIRAGWPRVAASAALVLVVGCKRSGSEGTQAKREAATETPTVGESAPAQRAAPATASADEPGDEPPETQETLEETLDRQTVARLENLVTSDPSDVTALDALARLRMHDLGRLVTLLDQRIARATARARATGAGPEGVLALERERERVLVLARGNAFPAFMREPPPPFAVKTRRPDPIRVLAFGDFGTGKEGQQTVARRIAERHRKRPFDFAITLGDNFYPGGMRGPQDPRWRTDWAELYDPLGIEFYVTFGNHDWVLPDSPAAEILYGASSKSWRMPAAYYTFTAGPAQFFAVDTDLLSVPQLDWLDRALRESKARWKVVYGHHPIRSHGRHGEFPAAVEKLLPLLRNRVQIYLCGHEHDLQELRAEDGVHFFVAGGGGQIPRPITAGPRSLFAASRNGFAEIDVEATTLTVTFVGDDGAILHVATVR